MLVKNNIVITNEQGEVVYTAHNTGTYSGITAIMNLIGNKYTNDAGKIKYLLVGDAGSGSAAMSDTSMATAVDKLHYYTLVSAVVVEASDTQDAAVTFTFTIPSDDSFTYNELGLAGDDANGTFNPSPTDGSTAYTGYILYAHHIVPTLNTKEDNTTLTMKWTISLGLATS